MGLLQGFVPLSGTIGYGATVWDLLPTYPPRLTEHGAGNQRNYSGNQVK
jgi:hypothetical protein